ncbi:MAG: hypothetical protein HC923_03670 [Myxococcales bacterium]|nr:hypothetical protein [Myxococcales bacterium]
MRRLWFVLLSLLATCGAPAYAGRFRSQQALLQGPCEGEYVLLAKWGDLTRELARVDCATLPRCVDIVGLWPDDMIWATFTHEDVVYGLKAVRDEAAVCPE